MWSFDCYFIVTMKQFENAVFSKKSTFDQSFSLVFFFLRYAVSQNNADRDYMRKIAFTDEATFSVDQVVNRHNCRIWGTENPHETFEKPRVSPKVQVWCGVHHSQIVGSCDSGLLKEVWANYSRTPILRTS